MFPKIAIMFSIFVFVVCFHVFYWRCISSKVVNTNLETLSRLLQSPERKDSFFQKLLSGYHKGRKVVLSYYFGGSPNNEFFIEPVSVPKAKKIFVLSYPESTKNTVLQGGKILFSDGNIRLTPSGFNFVVISEEKIRAILEELTEAAQKVEAGSVSA